MDRYQTIPVRNYRTDYNPNFYAGLSIILVIFSLFAAILLIISWWKIFVKAQKPGWASLIPGHVTVVGFEIAKMPGWYFFLLLIPLVNIYIIIKLIFKTAEVFGRSADFAWGMLLFPYIFYPILAFGGSEYLPTKPPIFNQSPGSQFSPGPTTPPTSFTKPEPIAQPIPTSPPPGFQSYGRPTGPLISSSQITTDNTATTPQETDLSSNSERPVDTPSSEVNKTTV